MKDHRKGFIAVLIAAILWSTGGMFIKLVSWDAFQLSGIRSLFAAIVFFILYRKDVLNVNGFTIINALLYAAVLIFFVMATKLTTAANAIFLQYTAPIYVLFLEPVINKTPFLKINVYTIILCFAGMLLFFVGELEPGHMTGNLLGLLSGAAFAAFLLGMRKNKPEYQLNTIFYGNILIFIICFSSILGISTFTLSDVWMTAYLGIFQIGLAYAIFSYGLKRVFAIEASLISMIEPVLNPVWVYLGYGEIPSFFAIIGGLIIITAISIRTILLESPAMKARLKL
jgi:drug/metabolite transporter, DME family